MAETSVFWGGIVTGDAGPYTDDQFSDSYVKLFQSDRTTQGPLVGLLGALAVTNPSGTTIRVASGHAIVDGKLYTNTANIDFSVTAPGTGSNYYRVILAKDFAAQTVRADILGPSAISTPALTQNDGTLWEISLATVQITSAGVITVTDSRTYCVYNSNIGAGAITGSQIASGTITHTNIANRTRTFYVQPDFHKYFDTSLDPDDYVECTRVQGPGWAWLTNTTYVNHFNAIFKVPDDFAGAMTVSPIFQSNEALADQQIVIDHSVGIGTFAEAVWENYESLDQVLVLSAGLGYKYPTLALTNVAIGDFVSISTTRDTIHGSDTGTGWVSFWGWEVSYTADM